MPPLIQPLRVVLTVTAIMILMVGRLYEVLR
jgi:hypothetical protein